MRILEVTLLAGTHMRHVWIGELETGICASENEKLATLDCGIFRASTREGNDSKSGDTIKVAICEQAGKFKRRRDKQRTPRRKRRSRREQHQ